MRAVITEIVSDFPPSRDAVAWLVGQGRLQRQPHRLVERQRPACRATALEFSSGSFAHPLFTFPTVTPPSAERRTGVFVLDRSPEASGALALSAFGGHTGEEAYAEHAARAVVQLRCETERLAGQCIGRVDASGVQREGRQLRERPAGPPVLSGSTRERGTPGGQLVSAFLVTRITGDRTERSRRLCKTPRPVPPI